MDVRPTNLRELARSPSGRKLVRYTLVSVISVVISQIVLLLTFGALHLWSARTCNIVAVVAGGVPSYYLNRNWAWGKSGKSHLWREVVPFWALAFAGLLLSTWAVDWTESFGHRHDLSHASTSVLVNLSAIAAFGVLWIGKFVLFNKVMFVHHIEDLPEALDGRTGLPT